MRYMRQYEASMIVFKCCVNISSNRRITQVVRKEFHTDEPAAEKAR